MTKHDNWRNYERAVTDATHDVIALTSLLEANDGSVPPELFAPAVSAEYALSDPICALQEAQTWSQARSALLFWAQRWPRAQAFAEHASPLSQLRPADDAGRIGAVARELMFSNQALMFALSELTARTVAFREIRPQHVGAAARIAYLEHRHG